MPNVSGIAGYVNGDIVRVNKVGYAPYLARAYYHQDIPLGGRRVPDRSELEQRFAASGPHGFAEARAEMRLEITIGKFASNDFFDSTSVSGDPHHRFLNWSLMNQGAWDYAADTRAYDYGAVLAFEHPRFAARVGFALMPKTVNGMDLDWNVAESGSWMVEPELRYTVAGWPGALKLLFYLNRAAMGNYDEAIARAAPGAPPNIDAVGRPRRIKIGGGLLVEQQIGELVRAYVRVGANDGATESFVFTEIDRSLSLGAEIAGTIWRRPADRVALGLAANGLSDAHARYLAAGGRGFQLGDGKLSYAPEMIVEVYYLVSLWRYLQLTFDVQAIVHPGMNADRGPTAVFGTRLHAHL
jgi:high affinity Mn2+ porin